MNLKVKPGTPREMDPTDNPTFEQWMGRVDAVCWRCAGLSVYDLPDCLYRDWYDKRLRPVWAAKKALARAGAPE